MLEGIWTWINIFKKIVWKKKRKKSCVKLIINNFIICSLLNIIIITISFPCLLLTLMVKGTDDWWTFCFLSLEVQKLLSHPLFSTFSSIFTVVRADTTIPGKQTRKKWKENSLSLWIMIKIINKHNFFAPFSLVLIKKGRIRDFIRKRTSFVD